MNKTMLAVEHLSCGYGKTPIIHDLSFRVEAGEKLCILGPNGCGKTTLLRALAGVLSSEGRVEADGLSLDGETTKQRAKKIALMSQFSQAAFAYTVYEAVMLGRYAHQSGFFPAETEADRAAVEEALRLADAWELREEMVTKLSGGQLQRVFLARVFAQDPKIILLDEPANHLDLRAQAELIESLREWTARGERCIVGVFHDISLALSFADSVLLLDRGSALACGPAKELDLSLLDGLYDMDVRRYMKTLHGRWG
ncbi:MAG: ABC transporter ATP-binding protein [Bacteroidales bacterium]|nr:ABC transporter ATP-binding protein [Bacteroidales bacterium]MCM1415297.1 ABC transporter ATP-binding protein [bacterium]MCM1423453.1 ABC transporter ATP-binding protein [bacterium]